MNKLRKLIKHKELTKTNLQKYKEYLNTYDKCGYTPLQLAANIHDVYSAELLINEGANLNINSFRSKTNALHIAAEEHQSDIIKLLIHAGADLNIKGYNEKTALHIAVEAHRLDIAKLLVHAGADLNVQDRYGSTPLHKAAFGCNLDIVKLLIHAGADISIKDHDGKTAYNLALDCYYANYGSIDSANAIKCAENAIKCAELTKSIIKIYDGIQILGNKSPSVASHLDRSKLLKLNVYCLEEILKNIDHESLEALKEACTIELYTKYIDNTESYIDTAMQAIGSICVKVYDSCILM